MNAQPSGTWVPGVRVTALSIALTAFACAAHAQEAIKLDLQVWNLSVKNLDTGPDTYHYANSGNVFAGVEGDLDALANIAGASFSLQYVFFPFMRGEGQPAQDSWQGKAGSFFAGAPMHNDIDTGYLARFTWNQRLLQDRLELAVGRSNARQHFYMANCENVITCNDPVIDNSTGILPYPYGSWGGYTRYRFDSVYYLHSGVFESNPQHYFKRTKGFDWDPGDASGVTWLAGVGAKANFTQAPYAYHYELNGFHNTGEQIDPMDGRLRRGSDGLLFKFRQTLAREGEAAVPERGWQVFGAWSWSADDMQPFSHFAEVGVTRLGPFGRPQDTLNLKASYLRLGARQAAWQEHARLLATGRDERTRRGVSRIELNTHWQVTRNLALEPSVQYIFNPDNFYNPSAPVSGDGAVIALEVMYNLGSALGL
ncbi:carbohydrate porin [Pseudomonas putida]|uniref:carbohydrate porin n=1 Tax=Pseudomonas putida TaxID=303 RepID=UPI00390674B1